MGACRQRMGFGKGRVSHGSMDTFDCTLSCRTWRGLRPLCRLLSSRLGGGSLGLHVVLQQLSMVHHQLVFWAQRIASRSQQSSTGEGREGRGGGGGGRQSAVERGMGHAGPSPHSRGLTTPSMLA
jgi:hypothetical protein